MNLSTHAVATLLAAGLIGGALAYYPAGALSDRIDRRIVIIVLACASALLCGLIVLRPHLSPGAILAVVAAFGFCQYPLYGVCVALTNDRVREQSFSEVASELLIIYGCGTVIGPLLAAALTHHGARYLFLFMGLVLGLLALFTAARVWKRDDPPPELKRKSHPLGTAPNSMQRFRPVPKINQVNESRDT